MDKNLQRLAREHSRQVIGGALIIAAGIARVAGYITPVLTKQNVLTDVTPMASADKFDFDAFFPRAFPPFLRTAAGRVASGWGGSDLRWRCSSHRRRRDAVPWLSQVNHAVRQELRMPDESAEVRGVASPVRAEVR